MINHTQHVNIILQFSRLNLLQIFCDLPTDVNAHLPIHLHTQPLTWHGWNMSKPSWKISKKWCGDNQSRRTNSLKSTTHYITFWTSPIHDSYAHLVQKEWDITDSSKFKSRHSSAVYLLLFQARHLVQVLTYFPWKSSFWLQLRWVAWIELSYFIGSYITCVMQVGNWKFTLCAYSKHSIWIKLTLVSFLTRVEAPITDHLRDFAPNLEKYKVVQFFSMYEDRNEEDYRDLVILSFELNLLWIFETKSWPKHITNVWSLS